MNTKRNVKNTASCKPVIDHLYRELYGKMVASLVSYFGLANLALAEDIVQDAFVTALEKWGNEGMPHDPPGWLFRVCKNKTINVLQKQSTKVYESVQVKERAGHDPRLAHLFLDHEIKDSQLRLLFACCHRSLPPKGQLILILKNLCGLKVAEIARALVMTDEAVMKTLSRSKQVLLDERVSVHVPFLMRSHTRLQVVHTAIYLMFNEGYAATQGEDLIRRDLCIEAMRLARTILDIPQIRNHDTFALMALMSFHSARFDAREGAGGELIELEEQDRTMWDKSLIALGFQYLGNAQAQHKVSRFVLEAAIASVHSVAISARDTNWRVIVGLYDQLSKLQSTPFTDLNRAVAVLYADGPHASRKALEASSHLHWLNSYNLYHALLGKIYTALDHRKEAIRSYKKALSLTEHRAEQDFLKRRISTLG